MTNIVCFILLTGSVCFSQTVLSDSSLDLQSSLEIGIVSLDEDIFVLTNIEQHISVKGFSVVFSGPFRLRIVDHEPSDLGVLRSQDWDEPSDFARIVPVLSFMRKFESGLIDFSAGQLNGVSIGNETIVSKYFNSVDMDRYKGGIHLQGEYRFNGAELLVDDIVSPNIGALRLYLAPISWFSDTEWSDRLQLCFLSGIDFRSPLRAYDNGIHTFFTGGGEIDLRLIERERLLLGNYFVTAAMNGDIGLHLGMTLNWSILSSDKLGLFLKGEYRYSGPKYFPALFNPFYDYNRFHFTKTDSPPNATFADHAVFGSGESFAHGFMAEILFEWRNKLQISARYDTAGRDRLHWIMFQLGVFPLKGYQIKGFFAGQSIEGSQWMFSENPIFGIEARGKIWKPIDLFFFFTRRWRNIPEDNRSANELGGGIGCYVSY